MPASFDPSSNITTIEALFRHNSTYPSNLILLQQQQTKQTTGNLDNFKDHHRSISAGQSLQQAGTHQLKPPPGGITNPLQPATMVRLSLTSRLKSYTGSNANSRSTSPNGGTRRTNNNTSNTSGGSDSSPESAKAVGLMLRVNVLKVCSALPV